MEIQFACLRVLTCDICSNKLLYAQIRIVYMCLLQENVTCWIRLHNCWQHDGAADTLFPHKEKILGSRLVKDFSVCKQKKISCLCSLCACIGSLRVLRFLRLPAKDKHVMLTDDGKIDRYAQVACLGWTRPMTSGIISSLPPNWNWISGRKWMNKI